MDHPDLLAHHILHYHPIIYVGKSSVNHPHRARLIPLWKSFAARFPLRYPHDPRRGAGQKNQHFPDFRDEWLPRAIQMIHTPAQTEINPRSFYRQRLDQITRDNAPRCITGFQFLVCTVRSGEYQNLKFAPGRFFLAGFYDTQMEHAEVDAKFKSCLSTRLDENELMPAYQETASDQTSQTLSDQTAPTGKKRKRQSTPEAEAQPTGSPSPAKRKYTKRSVPIRGLGQFPTRLRASAGDINH